MDTGFKQKLNQWLPAIIVILVTGFIIVAFIFFMMRFNVLRGFAVRLISILKPFIYGFVIAYLLKPLRDILERFLKNKLKMKKMVRITAVGLSIAFGLLVIYILLALVVPQLLGSITNLYYLLPHMVDELETSLEELTGDNAVINNYISDLADQSQTALTSWMQNNIMPSLNTLVSGIGESVLGIFKTCFNILIGIIVSAYILTGSDKFKKQLKMILYCLFPRKAADIIRDEIHYADKMFTGFIHGKIVDSAIIGIICYIGMLILRLPYPVLISVVVGVTNIIPFFGPYIGMIPSAIIILTVDTKEAVIFLIFIIILQQIDGNIIGPKILGNSTGLSAFWVLFSIMIFGGLFGFVGMIVGVPIFAVLYDIVKRLVYWGLEKRGLTEAVEKGL